MPQLKHADENAVQTTLGRMSVPVTPAEWDRQGRWFPMAKQRDLGWRREHMVK